MGQQRRQLDRLKVLAGLIGTPAQIGAERGSGAVDCYSMVGDYLAQTCEIDLPRYPGCGESIEACCADIELTMDAIGELLIAEGCESISPNLHRYGDIMRLKTKEEYAIQGHDSSYLGIDGGNTVCIVASALDPTNPRVRPVPLKIVDILAVYRPPAAGN